MSVPSQTWLMFHASDGAPEVVIWATAWLWGYVQYPIHETIVGEEHQGLMSAAGCCLSLIWPVHHLWFASVHSFHWPAAPLLPIASQTDTLCAIHLFIEEQDCFLSNQFYLMCFCVYVFMIIAAASVCVHIWKRMAVSMFSYTFSHTEYKCACVYVMYIIYICIY